MAKYKQGMNPNSRNGFKKGHKRTKEINKKAVVTRMKNGSYPSKKMIENNYFRKLVRLGLPPPNKGHKRTKEANKKGVETRMKNGSYPSKKMEKKNE